MKIWIAGLAIAAGLETVGAQNIPYATETGRVISGPLFDAGRMLLFSQHDYTFGTSRVTAMGGAFTSLGADLSSMSINPAGLGMYQSSDWGFTQALSMDGMRTTSPAMAAGKLTAGGNRISYGLNNIGAAYNVFNSSGTLTSLTLGFAYNRAANFNSRTRVETFDEKSSIADMFARQLNYYNIPSDNLKPGANPFDNLNIDLEWWGATLGYQTGMVSSGDGGGYGSIPLDSYFGSVTKGGIYEYDFSIGANLSNVLYLGATLGMTDVNYSEETSYEEFYDQNRNMWYDQSTSIRGSGLTAKLGAVVRPVEALRFGVAFHLPTYYSLQKSYTGNMGAGQSISNTGAPLMDELRMSTAPKLLAGISGVIADRAIIAIDWEIAWYNNIRNRSGNHADIENSKAESQRLYKPAHTFRAGFEYLLNNTVSLRAGGVYMMDFMREKNFVANNPAGRNGFSVTGGVGFNIGRNGYLDAAYVYNRTRQTDYDSYYFNEPDGGENWTAQFDTVDGREYSRTYTPTRHRHMITLTLGSRF